MYLILIIKIITNISICNIYLQDQLSILIDVNWRSCKDTQRSILGI